MLSLFEARVNATNEIGNYSGSCLFVLEIEILA